MELECDVSETASPSSGLKVMINMKIWFKELDYKWGNIRYTKVRGPDCENKLIYSSKNEWQCLDIYTVMHVPENTYIGVTDPEQPGLHRVSEEAMCRIKPSV
jgi:hypothetical protein